MCDYCINCFDAAPRCAVRGDQEHMKLSASTLIVVSLVMIGIGLICLTIAVVASPAAATTDPGTVGQLTTAASFFV